MIRTAGGTCVRRGFSGTCGSMSVSTVGGQDLRAVRWRVPMTADPLRYHCLSDPECTYTDNRFHKLDFYETLAAGFWPEGSIWMTPDGYCMVQDRVLIPLELVHVRQIMHNRRLHGKGPDERPDKSKDYYGRPNPRS